VTGRIDLRGRELQIRSNEVRDPDLGVDAPARVGAETLVVDLPAEACTNAVIVRLRELLASHPGGAAVRVRFLSSSGVTPLDVGHFRVNASGSLLGEIRALLGSDAARMEHEDLAAV
jgi:DNA polymerase III subunit alpha